MLARFFVDRPVFAWVLALLVMLFGGLALARLPIAEYPDVAPPTVSVKAVYPGASAEVLENTVTRVIEQQLTGIDGLLYFSSNSSSAGQAQIDVSFEQGTDPDTAQVQVQNKVQQALSRLPSEVQQQGLTVQKSQPDYLMVIVLYDETDVASADDMADYMASTILDPVGRTQGVGGVQLFGSPYAMRIWLDPNKLVSYGLMPSDIAAAVRAQNVEVSAGKIGEPPTPEDQQLNATVKAQSKLRTPAQFEAVIVKDSESGATVRLSDVARVELGAESYSTVRRFNRHPATGLAVQLTPGANALETAEAVRAVVDKSLGNMPDGYDIAYVRESTKFIELSIREVFKTLLEAIVLVVAVMYLFLQNMRATLVPAVAVPVVLLGTFGVLSVFGYSINTLTMFGLVLSIGLLVDDAIVVVENVERLMEEEKLDPREATIKSMSEITGALIGIAAVVSAVFLPMAFFPGSTGVIYRQFSITIVASMVISVLVALTLTPALCASIMKPSEPRKRGFFAWYNRNFDRATRRYGGIVHWVARRPWLGLATLVAVCGLTAWSFTRLPGGFLPNEDQGQAMVQWQLPAGATFERTQRVAEEVADYFLDEEADNVEDIYTISGISFSGRGQNVGLAFVTLKDWEQRTEAHDSAAAIAQRATQVLGKIRDGRVYALTPPPVRGLGRSAGFDMKLQARPGTDREALRAQIDVLLGQARKDPRLTSVRIGSVADQPQLLVDIDEAKATSLGLALSDVQNTLSAAWGGQYINDFIDADRVKRVYMQGDADYRAKPDDLNHWYVRGQRSGKMTPFSAFARTEWTYGPESLDRYNGLSAYPVQGEAAEGVASGTAMARMAELADGLTNDVQFEWSGLSYQQQLSEGQTTPLYVASLLVIFLCLAALYESWSVPVSVMLVVPLGLLGAAAAADLRGLENDVYFQVALLTTIGLTARNAILIIEFAQAAMERGQSAFDAAVEGARLRLRPILMTSISFGAGVLPLALSSGAGAQSRVAIGTGILGGTFSGTLLSLLLVPVFFIVVQRLVALRRKLGGNQTPALEGADAE